MSLGSVTRWACSRFKDDYQKIPKRKDYITQPVLVSDISSSNAPTTAIVVGSAVQEIRPYFRATVDVLAWVKGDKVEVGYTAQIGDKVNTVTYTDITQNGTSLKLAMRQRLDASKCLSIMQPCSRARRR